MDQILNIMVVEDEELLMKAIVKKLEINGLKTTAYASGKDALKYLSNATDIPDAIWLDYHLSDMDGLSFMGELKKLERYDKVPVFVVSNSASPEKVRGMLALGVEKYMVKAEHRLDELIEIIKTSIRDNKLI